MLSIAILWKRGGNPPIVFISVDWATRNHRAMIITVVWNAGGISKPDISEIEPRTLNGWSPWPPSFPSGLYNKHLGRLKTPYSRSFICFLTIHYKISWIPKFKSLKISKGGSPFAIIFNVMGNASLVKICVIGAVMTKWQVMSQTNQYSRKQTPSIQVRT